MLERDEQQLLRCLIVRISETCLCAGAGVVGYSVEVVKNSARNRAISGALQ